MVSSTSITAPMPRGPLGLGVYCGWQWTQVAGKTSCSGRGSGVQAELRSVGLGLGCLGSGVQAWGRGVPGVKGTGLGSEVPRVGGTGLGSVCRPGVWVCRPGVGGCRPRSEVQAELRGTGPGLGVQA